MESAKAENSRGRLTQGNDVNRLVLLNPVLACGNSLRNGSCREDETGDLLPLLAANEQLPEDESLFRQSHPCPNAFLRVRG
jgi:hypothetical protein